jgi:hypothetical protein
MTGSGSQSGAARCLGHFAVIRNGASTPDGRVRAVRGQDTATRDGDLSPNARRRLLGGNSPHPNSSREQSPTGSFVVVSSMTAIRPPNVRRMSTEGTLPTFPTVPANRA